MAESMGTDVDKLGSPVVLKTPDGSFGSNMVKAKTLEELKAWASQHLSKYKVPKLLQVVDEFPRNAMGKVMKPAVKGMFRQG